MVRQIVNKMEIESFVTTLSKRKISGSCVLTRLFLNQVYVEWQNCCVNLFWLEVFWNIELVANILCRGQKIPNVDWRIYFSINKYMYVVYFIFYYTVIYLVNITLHYMFRNKTKYRRQFQLFVRVKIDWLLNDEWDVKIRIVEDLSKYSIFSYQDQVFLAVDSLRVCSISGYLK